MNSTVQQKVTGATKKVHVAGSVDAIIQRCIRCGSQLNGAGWPAGSYWETGALISSHRGGMRLITATEAAQIRPCGRAK